MSSHSGLLAYSTLSYSSTIGGCPVPECIAVSWAHIDVCERFHERNLRQQQRSLGFGIPRLPACMVECSPTCMVCLYGRMQPNLSPVLLDIRTTPLTTHTPLQPLHLTTTHLRNHSTHTTTLQHSSCTQTRGGGVLDPCLGVGVPLRV